MLELAEPHADTVKCCGDLNMVEWLLLVQELNSLLGTMWNL